MREPAKVIRMGHKGRKKLMKDMKGVQNADLKRISSERAASSVIVGRERDPVRRHQAALPGQIGYDQDQLQTQSRTRQEGHK